MTQANQLNATEQDTLVKQIGLALLRAAPPDWQRIAAEYRAVGKYHELDGEVTFSDGTVRELIASHEVAMMFGKLRSGMYRDQRGTWFNAVYQLDAPASYNLEYDRDEPRWNAAPPSQAFSDELRMFPRSEENVPDWLMRRLAGLGPERTGPRFRFARVFDGTDPSGRPLVNRAELELDEQDKVLEYLETSPVVLPGNGMDIDRLAATSSAAVPVAFHCDGSWVWPAAVNFYLREYGVTPEPELLAHIRALAYTVPEVDDEHRAAARAYIEGGAPPHAAHRRQAPAEPASEPPASPAAISPAGPARPPEDTGEPAVLPALRGKLDELGVPPSRYTIGGPARHAWALEPLEAGWRVGWYEEALTEPAVFGDAEDAAAFLLGKLVLSAPRAEPAEASQAAAAREDSPLQAPAQLSVSSVAASGVSSARPASQQWPIQPLPGEPPLTLFRGKELQQLPAGSELDRFGSADGNLTYAAGTPFEERSLVPEWVHRTYHLYRVARPIEALTGMAIPWFNQPGGGQAYMLPVAIQDLVAGGVLIELEPGEPPID